MRSINIILIILAAVFLINCQGQVEQATEEPQTEMAADENPAAEGFNQEGSDTEAIEIADGVMAAMGGRKAWDNTRYISWTFFGQRALLWDKFDNKVRIEAMGDRDYVYLLDMNAMEGKIYRDGEEMTNPDSLSKYLNRAKSIWINDSYWLCMPLKLKDSGVTLKYLREDTTQAGAAADVLGLTFEEVGDTPHNRYEVWVDKEKNLVRQWAYYRYADQDSANWVRVWDNYQEYGNLMLSGDRESGGPGDIKVLESVPEEAFTSVEKITL